MEEHIFGLGNILNFRVNDQFIIWENYTIAVSSISVFSTGTSTKYSKKVKERSGFGKAMKTFGAVTATLLQMFDEDIPDRVETLGAALDLYGSETDLPCINLTLSNGVTLEITFVDLILYRENVKAIRQALVDSAKQSALEVSGKDVIVEGADFYGETHFIEGGKE